MPAPARTSLEQIVNAGLTVVEAEGLPALTMAAVAQQVGVRPPSLYKHVRNRAQLVRLVATRAVSELTSELDAVSRQGDAQVQLRAMADALRDFARRRPALYGLLFSPLPDESQPDAEVLTRASAPVLRVSEQLAGSEQALEAARTIVAWAHGFIDMELSGAFRLGGDVDAAYEFGITTIARALSRTL
jgi:AcrR family transcriptional regulator